MKVGSRWLVLVGLASFAGIAGCGSAPTAPPTTPVSSTPEAEPTPVPSSAVSAPPPSQAAQPPPFEIHPTGCPKTPWTETVVRAEKGTARVTVKVPPQWKVDLGTGRLQMTREGQPLELRLSVMSGGATMTEAGLHAMDQQTMGPYPVVSPWAKSPIPTHGPDEKAFTITHKGGDSTLIAHYLAGKNGLVLLTLEVVGPIEDCVFADYKRLVRELDAVFTNP